MEAIHSCRSPVAIMARRGREGGDAACQTNRISRLITLRPQTLVDAEASHTFSSSPCFTVIRVLSKWSVSYMLAVSQSIIIIIIIIRQAIEPIEPSLLVRYHNIIIKFIVPTRETSFSLSVPLALSRMAHIRSPRLLHHRNRMFGGLWESEIVPLY